MPLLGLLGDVHGVGGGDAHVGAAGAGVIVPWVPGDARMAALSADEDPILKKRFEQAQYRNTGRVWCESGNVLGDCVAILAGFAVQWKT